LVDNISDKDLQDGNATAVLKIINHLLFRASECFTKHLHEYGNGVNKDLKFLPDTQFYKSLTLILCDMFGYRVDLSHAQFFAKGYSEKKMIMALDIYDILKKTRKGIKVNTKLTRKEIGATHADDETIKEYQVINHRENV
jgi:hypothetical protein